MAWRALARRERARRWLSRLLLGVGVLVVGGIGVAFYAQISMVLDLHAQQVTLQADLSDLQRENTTLKQQLSLQDDPNYLDYMTRKLLGWIKPGETKYILPPNAP